MFAAHELEQLQAKLLPFATGWTTSTGRTLRTVRDGFDFIVAMKQHDLFWRALVVASSDSSGGGALQTLRQALPVEAPGSEESMEARLGTLGLSRQEVEALLSVMAHPQGVDDAVREAFSAASPQGVARALEAVLDTSPDIITTERCVRHFSGFRRTSGVLGTLMGIVLFLVGAACPAGTASASDDGAAASASTAQDAASAKKPRRKPPMPAPLYKGISPHRLSK
jgi:hypothetical protein